MNWRSGLIRIESFAIIKLRGVNYKLYKYILFSPYNLETFKELTESSRSLQLDLRYIKAKALFFESFPLQAYS
jgi:hypothetical protein